MSDIVERLRAASAMNGDTDIRWHAADEIERLRASRKLSPDNAYSEEQLAIRCALAEAEIERLRAALSDILLLNGKNLTAHQMYDHACILARRALRRRNRHQPPR